MPVNHAGIPQAWKDCPHWLLWKFEERDGKKTKVPIQPKGRNASTTNPKTWSDFETVKKFHDMHVGDGLGFVFTRDTFSGVDQDHCRDKSTGEIDDWAKDYLSKFSSYAEISPSGEGVHIIVKGAIREGYTGKKKELKDPEGTNVFERWYGRKAAIEIYSEGRFFTVTGNHVQGTPETVEERQEVLREVYDDVFFVDIINEIETAERHNKPNAKRKHTVSILSDDALIQKATLAKNGTEFKALWDGSTLGYGGDESAADLALANHLCFWSGGDAAQMDRLFRQSKLMRPKWDEKHGARTYGEMTIQKAIDDTIEVYEPKKVSRGEVGPNVLEYDDCFILIPVTDKKGDVVKDKETGEPLMKITFSATHSKESIETKFNLGMTKGDEKTIWRFDGGVYRDNGRPFFRNAVYDVADDKIKAKDVNEVFDRLTAALMLKPVKFNPNPFLFPAIDGMLDLRTGEVRDGAPADLMTFSYNAHCHLQNADYDRFLFYLATSLPDLRDCLTAMDLYTKAVIRIPFDTFAFLIGGGENGKGIFEKVLIELLGMGRVSAAKFDEFKRSHFALGGLIDKDAWIVTEVETAKDATAVIKAVSSGEMIDSDVKYNTDRARGTPHLLPILDSNKAIDFKDPSWGRKRRTLKLDFPYEFGYKTDTRPKDPHLLENLKAPESLAGILQIIKARAPSLIAARKIYRRKSSEEQEAELDRQRFSLQYFCNDCLVKEADWPEKIDPMDEATKPPRLTTDVAFKLYREYCKLWNVPEPAEKVPLGRYICEKISVESAVGSDKVDGKQKSYRFYSGLFCSKSPVAAHAEIYVDYSEILQRTTDILQMWIGEKNDSRDYTTDTTDKQVLLDAIEKLDSMYKYVQSCHSCRDITWEKFQAHLSVVSVVNKKNGSDESENSHYRETTDPKSSVVKSSPDTELQMNQAQATAPSDSLPPSSPVDVKTKKTGSGPHPPQGCTNTTQGGQSILQYQEVDK